MTVSGVIEQLPALGLSGLNGSYWQGKGGLPDVFFYGRDVPLRPTDRDDVEELRAGRIQTYSAFPRVELGMPPAWGGDWIADPTWDFYRHCLRWSESLLRLWIAEGDARLLDLWLMIIRDWARANLPAPGASKFAWFDHASANRLRRLCWSWELYRKQGSYDETIASELNRPGNPGDRFS